MTTIFGHGTIKNMILEKALEDSLIARAEFIIRPDDLLSHAWGILAVCSARPELEAVLCRTSFSFEIIQTESDAMRLAEKLMNEEKCSADTFQKQLASYRIAHRQYDAEEERRRLCRKNKELAKGALKSVKAQNAWLNRENAESNVRCASIEREINDLEKAQKQNEQKIERLQRVESQYEELLPGYAEKERRCTQEALEDEAEIRQAQAQLSLSDRLFRVEHFNEVRRYCAQLAVRVDNKRMEASHALASYQDLAAKQTDTRMQLEICMAARKNMIISMRNSRLRYTQQEKGLHAGKGMITAQDERLAKLERRIQDLSSMQEALDHVCVDLHRQQVHQAHELLRSYVHLDRFQRVLKKAVEQEEKEVVLRMLLFAADGIICSGSSASAFWKAYDMHAWKRVDI